MQPSSDLRNDAQLPILYSTEDTQAGLAIRPRCQRLVPLQPLPAVDALAVHCDIFASEAHNGPMRITKRQRVALTCSVFAGLVAVGQTLTCGSQGLPSRWCAREWIPFLGLHRLCSSGSSSFAFRKQMGVNRGPQTGWSIILIRYAMAGAK